MVVALIDRKSLSRFTGPSPVFPVPEVKENTMNDPSTTPGANRAQVESFKLTGGTTTTVGGLNYFNTFIENAGGLGVKSTELGKCAAA